MPGARGAASSMPTDRRKPLFVRRWRIAPAMLKGRRLEHPLTMRGHTLLMMIWLLFLLACRARYALAGPYSLEVISAAPIRPLTGSYPIPLQGQWALASTRQAI